MLPFCVITRLNNRKSLRQNILITAPTGVGKSYGPVHWPTERVWETSKHATINVPREDHTHLHVLKQLARIDVLLLDDWELHEIQLTGDSMRKIQAEQEKTSKSDES